MAFTMNKDLLESGSLAVMRENTEETKVTFGDMAEALYRLRQKYGMYYSPSERVIFEECLRYLRNDLK